MIIALLIVLGLAVIGLTVALLKNAANEDKTINRLREALESREAMESRNAPTWNTDEDD